MYKKVDPKFNLPKTEEEILKFWDENKIFEKSLENRKDSPICSFFDGPPFATGTPHYGHIVGSVMKDVVPRYWTMKGYRVDRVWGWDCHGLPIENIAEKSLKITHKKQILEMGIDKFNETCRSKVLDYVKEWEIVIHRLGRWADMKNAYKTMDLTYMESVWWVFKQLWDKGLVYEGYRSMHVCPRCETTLSQSEVSEGYTDVKDLSLIAKFELTEEPNTYILAWTTTPWTLIGNVALAVGENITYLKVKSGQETLILAETAFEQLKKEMTNPKILEKITGKELLGKSYKPLFDYYSKNIEIENHKNGWKIYSADFVTVEEGTGVVHIAPAFGEDDMVLGKEKNLPFIQHVKMDGTIKEEATDFAGLQVKPIEDHQKTDVEIIKYLFDHNLLFSKDQYLHSYPHCWRCETPLINYATSSWFVSVEKIKKEMLTNAKEINWSPKNIKNGRFGKWLEGARDWSISRQRFWASVIPIWKCEKCEHIKVIGSVKELEDLSGQKITDIHKHKVDPIVFVCSKCKGNMKRIPDVLDTWFDSGSMPYAQMHYPFENESKFEKSFPAQFIAEGIDQTRAWFYYQHVISTAIMQKIAFKNVIVNGTVLAEDGKKMSKRLQNYPDPAEMFNKYGADVMRFYLLQSTVMQAENLNFSESDMADLSRGMFRMLWNSYSFFVLYANIDKWSKEKNNQISTNVLDRWILSELNMLIKNVNQSMKQYDLLKSSRYFPAFIDNFSNWYIRRSRKRFWKSENDLDKVSAYNTLYTVLVELSKLLAPFTPFLSDEIYKNLTKKESVHLESYPEADEKMIDITLISEMSKTREIIESGLSDRAKFGIKVRQPLQSITYSGTKLEKDFEQIIAEEVNVKKVIWDKNNKNLTMIDKEITLELKLEGISRDLIRNIQSQRKESGFEVDNRIILYYSSQDKELNQIFIKFGDVIKKEVLASKIIDQKNDKVDSGIDYKIGSGMVWIGMTKE